MSGVAVLFPGQGSQEVGMGADLFENHPEVLGSVSDRILGWSLRDVCLNGPIENLTRTVARRGGHARNPSRRRRWAFAR